MAKYKSNLSSNDDVVSLFDYEHVYRLVEDLSLPQLYFLLSILPEVFFREFPNEKLFNENLFERFSNYSNVLVSLHDNLSILSNSDLTRLRLYVDRLVFKSRIKSDDDFINQSLDDVSPSKNSKYEKSKKIR